MATQQRDTWVGPEEMAYNTPSGAHSRSGRRGRVRWPDGRIRAVTLGVPDTFYTIPAHGRLHGRYVSGYVSLDTDTREYRFHETSG